MNWFEKIIPPRRSGHAEGGANVPGGVWMRCESCEATLYRAEVEKQKFICPKCGHHMQLTGRRRLEYFLDPGSSEEIAGHLESVDPLQFRDSRRYTDRLSSAKKATSEKDALVVLRGRLKGLPVVAAAFDFNFMGGSMGSVVGEKFFRGAQHAISTRTPYVCFTASGGARMQESMHSLHQMAKTSAVLKKMQNARLPYIVVLTHPTMGGVSASLAMLGDVIIAEPGASVGFAGTRVIQQVVRETLPENFQKSEFLLEHGHIDMIVARTDLRNVIHQLLDMLTSGSGFRH